LAGLIALSEFYELARKTGSKPHEMLGYTASVVIALCFMLDHRPWVIFAFAVTALLALVFSLRHPDEMNLSLASASVTLFGVAYIGLMIGFLIAVRMLTSTIKLPETPHLSAKLLTMFFAMVMLTDTGAFYAGRSLGKRKLAPLVSPGKTIEGAVGGLAWAILAGPLCRIIFFHE